MGGAHEQQAGTSGGRKCKARNDKQRVAGQDEEEPRRKKNRGQESEIPDRKGVDVQDEDEQGRTKNRGQASERPERGTERSVAEGADVSRDAR